MSTVAPGWQIGFGQVMHRRVRPAVNHFVYRCFFLQGRFDLDRADNGSLLARTGNFLFGVNRPALVSWRATDHGNGPNPATWLNEILAQADLPPPAAVTYRGFATVLGYTFKPVSFWFCENREGQTFAIVAEVNNTFGERHCYLLANGGGPMPHGRALRAVKQFHVSPFCQVNGSYLFRFDERANRSTVRIDHHDESGPVLQTSMSGAVEPVSRARALQALTGYPLFTLGVIARIHWQALRLWRKRVPFFRKPAPPLHTVSSGSIPSSES